MRRSAKHQEVVVGAERAHVTVELHSKIAFPYARAGQFQEALQSLLCNRSRAARALDFSARLSSTGAVESIVKGEVGPCMNFKQALRQNMRQGVDANEADVSSNRAVGSRFFCDCAREIVSGNRIMRAFPRGRSFCVSARGDD